MAKKNFKQLALDHFEKVAFGLFVLVAVVALAGTRWSPYTGTPREITERITRGRQTWKTNVWPQEEQQTYVISREAAPANLLYERIYKEFSPAPIEPSGRMVVDIRGGDEPVREPDLVAVQNPIATSGRVFLEILSDQPSATDPQAPASAMTPLANNDNLPDEFRTRQNAPGMGVAGEGASLDYITSVDMTMPSEMLGMEAMGPKIDLNGQGYHFVSVRGVFPLRDQILKYADAIHKNYHYAASIFDILDFELERQIAQPAPQGADRWSGPWEKVDLQAANDILDKAADFDAEVVNSSITNAVITMPLPMRISGEWRRQATHPQIEKFELTDAQIAMETEMQRKLLQEAAAQRKQMDAAVTKRGGFAHRVIDSRQLEADMLGVNMYSPTSGIDMMGGIGAGPQPAGGPAGRNPRTGTQANPLEKLVADMAKGAVNRTEEEKRIREWIQSRVSADGELLLFRYLDFNVEPGKEYRYRIRLVLKNPNFGRRIADAGGVPHVVEGETRLTPWSQITKPVYVEEDIKYFVTDLREQFGKVLPTAKFDVFEWNPKHGTFMNSPLEVRMGQPISDEVETTVIDPAKGLNESQKYRFSSQDYFVDAVAEIRLDESLHAKGSDPLQLPPSMRGKLAIAPQTLVARPADERLVFLSSVANHQEHTQQKSYIEMQAKQFEYLKAPKVDEAAAALAGLGLAPGEEGMMEGSAPRRKSSLKRSSRNPRRGAEGSGMSSP